MKEYAKRQGEHKEYVSQGYKRDWEKGGDRSPGTDEEERNNITRTAEIKLIIWKCLTSSISIRLMLILCRVFLYLPTRKLTACHPGRAVHMRVFMPESRHARICISPKHI